MRLEWQVGQDRFWMSCLFWNNKEPQMLLNQGRTIKSNYIKIIVVVWRMDRNRRKSELEVEQHKWKGRWGGKRRSRDKNQPDLGMRKVREEEEHRADPEISITVTHESDSHDPNAEGGASLGERVLHWLFSGLSKSSGERGNGAGRGEAKQLWKPRVIKAEVKVSQHENSIEVVAEKGMDMTEWPGCW